LGNMYIYIYWTFGKKQMHIIMACESVAYYRTRTTYIFQYMQGVFSALHS